MSHSTWEDLVETPTHTQHTVANIERETIYMKIKPVKWLVTV